MTIQYIKMNGLGNTFVIFDARENPIRHIPLYLLNKHVIYDQKIIIEKSSKADCRMLIYNVDGSSASACGNATRCVSRLLGTDQCTIEVGDRILYATNHEDGMVSVKMGAPLSQCYGIPLGKEIDLLPDIKGYVVDIGNPHVILFGAAPNAILGRKLERHALFHDRINVNFATIIDPQTIKLTTWERGVGFTKACGAGACATAFISHYLERVGDQVTVKMEMGSLFIHIDNGHVTMKGAAEFDGKGQLEI